MKLSLLLSGALLPFGLMAAPGPEAESSNDLDSRAIYRPQQCQIIGGATEVNCRTGARTTRSVRTKLHKGTVHNFWCVVSGECVTIGGSTNWYVHVLSSPHVVNNSSLTMIVQSGWHYSRDYDCYVNGHYTDNHCTLGT
jgi:hypothetical protein